MQLNYYTCGEGFPLVILHGLFGSSDNWQTISKQLKPEFNIFAVDLRNHGNSPHLDPFDYQVMAEDVRDFVNSQQLREVFLLGHSMGGKVAMQFASRFPERVRKLIVADIAPKDYPPHHADTLAAMTEINLATFNSRSEIDEALAGKIPDAAIRQFLLKSVGRNDAGRFIWKINLAGIREHTMTRSPPRHPSIIHSLNQPFSFVAPIRITFYRKMKVSFGCTSQRLNLSPCRTPVIGFMPKSRLNSPNSAAVSC
jgi:esterase